jgi:hypothetical protein
LDHIGATLNCPTAEIPDAKTWLAMRSVSGSV